VPAASDLLFSAGGRSAFSYLSPVLEQLLNHIRSHELFAPGDKILLAVSGGIDSMVMLHLLHHAGVTVGVAHCNFQLRGSESDEDENFVRRICQALDVPFYTTRFHTEVYSAEHKLSIQMAARELRYAWFNTILAQQHYTAIATAHHLNDSLETVLLNLIHGVGLDGLTGIAVKNGPVIRPLLFATRTQIEEYAHAYTIHWREDRSNKTDDYQRNFIRHQVVPRLQEINPSLEQTVQRGLQKLAGDAHLAALGQAQWEQVYVTHRPEKTLIEKKGLQHHTPASVLWRFLKKMNFNLDICDDIVSVVHQQPGKKFFSSSHQLVVDREHIIITPLQEHWPDVTIRSFPAAYQLGIFSLAVTVSDDVAKSTDTQLASLDADTITWPLTWRVWKAGDTFQPLGMKGRKKISDFLIDNKIPVSDKQHVTVLACGDDIVWVAGHRIDDRYKITGNTKRIVCFHLSSHFPR
jgi:tRNA(Ile)-lysidine synthase